ncbi:MAG TPA: TlpA disulfide reductase family protein [Paracoccaceae bacterium]|nr:TlpA disulfide reductase family protein [Paracoccaceae bacterium]
MRRFSLIVLYTALTLGANAALAEVPPGVEVIKPFLTGEMAKMVPASEALTLPEAALLDAADGAADLAPYRDKVLLVNFWATWCAPCRAELAALDRLQGELGGETFAVMTVATGRNPVPAIEKLFADEGISHLPILRDTDQAFARASGVLGLPVSILVDRDGTEIARLVGDAEWDSDEAKALIRALLDRPAAQP